MTLEQTSTWICPLFLVLRVVKLRRSRSAPSSRRSQGEYPISWFPLHRGPGALREWRYRRERNRGQRSLCQFNASSLNACQVVLFLRLRRESWVTVTISRL